MCSNNLDSKLYIEHQTQDDSNFLAELILPVMNPIVSYASLGLNPLEDSEPRNSESVEEDVDADLSFYSDPDYDSIYYIGEQEDDE